MARLSNVYVLASAPQTTTITSADIVLDSQANALLFLMNVSAVAGTTPTLQATINGKGPDNVYYPLYVSASITATGKTQAYIGPTLPINIELTPVIQVVFVIGGTTPSFTFSATIEQESS